MSKWDLYLPCTKVYVLIFSWFYVDILNRHCLKFGYVKYYNLLQEFCKIQPIKYLTILSIFVISRKCVSKYPTIMDLLLIKDPNVTNYLIDTKHIESVIIIPDDSEAFRVLKSVETVPKNCRYALTFNFGQYFPAPNSRSYTNRPDTSANEIQQKKVSTLSNQ